jgi:hypothetical protein
MITLFILIAVLAAIGAIAAVPLVLRDGHHRVPTLRDYDTRRPALRA